MDAISNKVVSLGSVFSNIKAPVETAPVSDAEAVSRVASVPLPQTSSNHASMPVDHSKP